MKILIVTIEGGGNIPPVLNTLRRLVKRGHEVFILSEPWMQELVESNQGRFITFQTHFTKMDRRTDILEDWKDRNNGFKNAIFGPARVTTMETAEAIKSHKIDLVIADVLQPSALIAAKAAGIPGVLLFHMPEYLPGRNRPPGGLGLIPGKGSIGRLRDRLLGKVFNLIFDKYLKEYNAIRKDHRLQPLKHIVDLFHEADLRIIQTSKAFDIPVLPAPTNVRYTGPVVDDPDWVTPWQNPWPQSDHRPLVVVSFSSTFQNQHELIQRCMNALAELPVRGLVTLGLAMEELTFSIPENVHVIANASHDQVFKEASAVITHAGHGTVVRALTNGLPLICIPMGRDQGDNASKVVLHGVGKKLSMKAKKSAISKAVEEVIKDKCYKENAARLGKILQKDADSNNIVEELEALISQT